MGILDKFRRKRPAEPPKEEVSPGGSTIYRYQEPEQVYHSPEAQGVYAEAVTKRFEELFPGRRSFVFHEILSDLVHIDVYILEPTEKENYYVLYTTGMSDRPMTLPQELSDREDLKYAELYLFLPGDWNLGERGALDSDLPYESYWPIQMLKFLARFPHEYHTWLGWGHTIPNGPDYTPICDGVGFGGAVLTWSGGRLGRVETEDGHGVMLYGLVPAYKEEIEYKLKYGMEGLDEKFREGKLPMVLDIHRPNLCEGFTETFD